MKMCGVDGCEHKGNTWNMKIHKAAKHGINVVWFPCGEVNCDYKAKQAGTLKRHKQFVHDIGVVWYPCDLCEYKAKQASVLKTHKQRTHEQNEQDLPK